MARKLASIVMALVFWACVMGTGNTNAQLTGNTNQLSGSTYTTSSGGGLSTATSSGTSYTPNMGSYNFNLNSASTNGGWMGSNLQYTPGGTLQSYLSGMSYPGGYGNTGASLTGFSPTGSINYGGGLGLAGPIAGSAFGYSNPSTGGIDNFSALIAQPGGMGGVFSGLQTNNYGMFGGFTNMGQLSGAGTLINTGSHSPIYGTTSNSIGYNASPLTSSYGGNVIYGSNPFTGGQSSSTSGGGFGTGYYNARSAVPSMVPAAPVYTSYPSYAYPSFPTSSASYMVPTNVSCPLGFTN